MKFTGVIAGAIVLAGAAYLGLAQFGADSAREAVEAGREAVNGGVNLGLVSTAQAQPGGQIDKDSIVKPTLMANTTAIEPGTTFTLGILYKIQPGWHTYYKYPGASGFATTVKWGLPTGASMGETMYPAPIEFESPGPVISFGYEDEAMLMVEARAADLPADGNVQITAKTRWLMCSDRCIPNSKELTLTLPVGEGEPANQAIFQKYKKQVPQAARELPEAVKVVAKPEGSTTMFEMTITPPEGKKLVASGPDAVNPAYFFPADQDGYVIQPPQTVPEIQGEGSDQLQTFDGPVKIIWKAEPTKNAAEPLKRVKGTLVYQTVTNGKPDKPVLLEVDQKV